MPNSGAHSNSSGKALPYVMFPIVEIVVECLFNIRFTVSAICVATSWSLRWKRTLEKQEGAHRFRISNCDDCGIVKSSGSFSYAIVAGGSVHQSNGSRCRHQLPLSQSPVPRREARFSSSGQIRFRRKSCDLYRYLFGYPV